MYIYLQVFCADIIVYSDSFESIRNIQACVQILVECRKRGKGVELQEQVRVEQVTHLAGTGRDDGGVQGLLLAANVQANLLEEKERIIYIIFNLLFN